MKNLLIILLFFLASVPVRGQAKQDMSISVPADAIKAANEKLEKNPDDVEALKSLTRVYSYLRDNDQVLTLACRIRDIGERTDNREDYLFGLVSIGQAFYCMEQPDSMFYYFDKSLLLAKETEDHWALIMIYNSLGVYSVEVEMDYYKALSYFLEGVKFGKDSSDPRLYPLLSNLASTYYMRKDPAGLPYALEVYKLGYDYDHSFMRYVGSHVLAGMYYILKDYESALKYVKEAATMVDIYGQHTGVYNIYANILLAMGNEKEAVDYYNRALGYVDQGRAAFVIEVHLNYAEYLMGKGRHPEAISYLEKGLEVSLERHNTLYRYLLYKNLSESHERLGNIRESLRYYKTYHNQADSIFNIQKERSLDELRVKYETEKQERELRAKELELLKEARKLQITVFISVIILLALGATYMLYRRQNKLYKRIVRQQHDFVKMGRVFEESGKPSDVSAQNDGKYSVSSLSDEKGRAMFRQLEKAMLQEQLYKDKDITIEKLAEKLDTNRTYLSQIINENTGASFNHYINSYRINEAVRVLSDPGTDIQLKVLAYDLGFNYRETFYKSFQKAIGMSPSKYREEISKMYGK